MTCLKKGVDIMNIRHATGERMRGRRIPYRQGLLVQAGILCHSHDFLRFGRILEARHKETDQP